MRLLRFIRRLVLVTLVLVVVAAIAVGVWASTHRDQARAWRQVLVIGALMSDVGLGDALGEAIAADTADAERRQLATSPATVVVPDDGRDRHPALALLVPPGTSTVEERRVRDAQRAAAAAGFAAWAVRVPDPDEAFVDPTQLEQLDDALAEIADHRSTDERRVSVVALGPTASLVLRVAARPGRRDVIRAVVAVQPLADVRGLVSVATTGAFVDRNGMVRQADVSPHLRSSAGAAIIQAIRAELPDSPLLEPVLTAAEASDDPLAALALVPPRVAGPRLRPLLDVLRAETPVAFDAAWERLPLAMRRAADASSPLPVADRIRARVLLVQATDEPWARADIARLQRAIDDVDVLRVDGADPGSFIEDPAAIRDSLGLSAWWLQRAGSP